MDNYLTIDDNFGHKIQAIFYDDNKKEESQVTIDICDPSSWSQIELKDRVFILKAWTQDPKNYVSIANNSFLQEVIESAFSKELQHQLIYDLTSFAFLCNFPELLTHFWQYYGKEFALQLRSHANDLISISVSFNFPLCTKWAINVLLVGTEYFGENNNILHLYYVSALAFSRDELIKCTEKHSHLLWERNEQGILPLGVLFDFWSILSHHEEYRYILLFIVEKMLDQNLSDLSKHKKDPLFSEIVVSFLECKYFSNSIVDIVWKENFHHVFNFFVHYPNVVDWQDCNGFTLLTFAILHNQIAAVETLLNHNANVFVEDNIHCFPLAYAASQSCKDIWHKVFSIAQKSGIAMKQYKCIWYHMLKASNEILRSFCADNQAILALWEDVALGFDIWYSLSQKTVSSVNEEDEDNNFVELMTVLCLPKFEEVTKRLIFIQDPLPFQLLFRSNNNSIIFKVDEKTNNTIIHQLINSGEDEQFICDCIRSIPSPFMKVLWTPNNDKIAPIHIAIERELSVLLETTMLPALKEASVVDWGQCLIHPFLFSVLKGSLSVIILMLHHFPEYISVTDQQGRSGLFYAIDTNSLEIVRQLVNDKADLLQVDNNNVTPLAYCVCQLSESDHNSRIFQYFVMLMRKDKNYYRVHREHLLDSTVLYAPRQSIVFLLSKWEKHNCYYSSQRVFYLLLLRSCCEESKFREGFEFIWKECKKYLGIVTKRSRFNFLYVLLEFIRFKRIEIEMMFVKFVFQTISFEDCLEVCPASGNSLLHLFFLPIDTEEEGITSEELRTIVSLRMNFLLNACTVSSSIFNRSCQSMLKIKNIEGDTPLHYFASQPPIVYHANALSFLCSVVDATHLCIKNKQGLFPIHVAVLMKTNRWEVEILQNLELVIQYYSVLNPVGTKKSFYLTNSNPIPEAIGTTTSLLAGIAFAPYAIMAATVCLPLTLTVVAVRGAQAYYNSGSNAPSSQPTVPERPSVQNYPQYTLGFRLILDLIPIAVGKQQEIKKFTTLHLAAQNANISMTVLKLLAVSAESVDINDELGNSPLDYAKTIGKKEVIETLQFHSKAVFHQGYIAPIILALPAGSLLVFVAQHYLPKYVETKRVMAVGASATLLIGGIAVIVFFPPASIAGAISTGALSGALIKAGFQGAIYSITTQRFEFKVWGKELLHGAITGAISGAISGGIGHNVGEYLKASEKILSLWQKGLIITGSGALSGGVGGFATGYVGFGLQHGVWGEDAVSQASLQGAIGILTGGLGSGVGFLARVHIIGEQLPCWNKKFTELAIGTVTASALGGGSGYLLHGITTGDYRSEKAWQAAAEGAVSAAIAHVITSTIRLAMEELCFAAGTLVHLLANNNNDDDDDDDVTTSLISSSSSVVTIPIEQLKCGDVIQTWNETLQCVEFKPVQQIFCNTSPSTLLRVTFMNHEIIDCTSEHPFYELKKGWTAAITLQCGDQIQCLFSSAKEKKNVNYQTILSVETIRSNHSFVYNLEILDNHNYFVGTSGYLVHNACILIRTMGKEEVDQLLKDKELKPRKENDTTPKWVTMTEDENPPSITNATRKASTEHFGKVLKTVNDANKLYVPKSPFVAVIELDEFGQKILKDAEIKPFEKGETHLPKGILTKPNNEADAWALGCELYPKFKGHITRIHIFDRKGGTFPPKSLITIWPKPKH